MNWLEKSKLLAFGNKNKLLLHFINRNFAELWIKITIFAASIRMSCVTEGWADILEEALAFSSCHSKFGKIEKAIKSESWCSRWMRGLLLVDVH